MAAVMQSVTQQMQGLPLSYLFTSTRLGYLGVMPLPFQLLSLVGRGNPRAADNQIRLSAQPVTQGMMIDDLAGDKNHCARPVCIEGEPQARELAIHFSERLVVCVLISKYQSSLYSL